MEDVDKFKEECGVFGLFNNNEDILKTSEIIYFRIVCFAT